MRIAIPQINYKTGDIRANREQIIQAIQKARQAKAELVIFPELAVCGALSEDWLEREDFIQECRMAIEQIASHCGHIAAIVGAPNLDSSNGIMYNSAYFIQDGEVTDGVHKTILSDYDLFNESRYFVAGEDNTPIRYKNKNIRILFDEYEAEEIDKQDHFIVYIGITPFSTDSYNERNRTLSALAQKYRKPFLSVNYTGAETAVIFDGNSTVYNPQGQLVARLKAFEEDFTVIDTEQLNKMPVIKNTQEDKISLLHKALILGIKDYFYKNGFKTAVLGLSGGIDSAVVAALAVEALGAENVRGLLMPSRFSTDHSVQDALDLVKNTGIRHDLIPIKDIYDQYLNALKDQFKDQPFNVAEENLQARIRGTLVMAISNKFGNIALNTSNKSEAAVGYGTLYGDLCGSLGVIGDVYKSDIFKLARHINREREIIPENTIIKAPSAELHPNQKDQDTLPPYDELDAILKLYIEENLSAQAIIEKGHKKEIVDKTISMVKRNEYKRAQCPPILRVSDKAFGQGRKYPY